MLVACAGPNCDGYRNDVGSLPGRRGPHRVGQEAYRLCPSLRIRLRGANSISTRLRSLRDCSKAGRLTAMIGCAGPIFVAIGRDRAKLAQPPSASPSLSALSKI